MHTFVCKKCKEIEKKLKFFSNTSARTKKIDIERERERNLVIGQNIISLVQVKRQRVRYIYAIDIN